VPPSCSHISIIGKGKGPGVWQLKGGKKRRIRRPFDLTPPGRENGRQKIKRKRARKERGGGIPEPRYSKTGIKNRGLLPVCAAKDLEKQQRRMKDIRENDGSKKA